MTRFFRPTALALCCWLGVMLPQPGWAAEAEFSASFKGTDIQEFINTVSKNLNKTVIIDPNVHGNITVRSYDMLNKDQYYQFFLSVLEVYGFAAIPMDNGVIKVVQAKNAKASSIPVVDDNSTLDGDEVVTRVVPLHNVTARDLSPLLRQLNDNAGVGNVVHYDPSNVLLLTGRAAVINRLIEIINKVDKAGDQTVETVPLNFASAPDVARLVTQLTQDNTRQGMPGINTAKIVADERTNSVLVSGEQRARQRLIAMVKQLDKKQLSQGNTQVIYLKYAKADNLVEVLTGVSKSLEGDKNSGKSPAVTPTGLMKETVIKADAQTNSLIINAAPDVMRALQEVIAKLDIRRPQVLVEAIIAEVEDADGLNLGIQWANKNVGVTQFTNTGLPITTAMAGIDQYRKDGTVNNSFANALSSLNGIAAGFYSGNWAMLLTALSNDTKNDILATPSIVTLDNMEANFNVGQEVPVLTGTRASTTGDNVFNTVDRKTVGIKLKVKPQINDGGSVLLEIEEEVSSVAPTASGSNQDLGPTFNTRTLSNAVLINSGETVVIGGLLNNSRNESNSKVPLLGDIPILGYLFRSTSRSVQKTNLMLFLRPTIIHDQQTYNDESSKKYAQYRTQQQDYAEGRSTKDENDTLLNLPDLQRTQAFNEVRSAITLFYNTSSK